MWNYWPASHCPSSINKDSIASIKKYTWSKDQQEPPTARNNFSQVDSMMSGKRKASSMSILVGGKIYLKILVILPLWVEWLKNPRKLQ